MMGIQRQRLCDKASLDLRQEFTGRSSESREMLRLRQVKRIKLGPRIYRRLITRVLDRDGWKCQKCGSLENLQVHHKVKRSRKETTHSGTW